MTEKFPWYSEKSLPDRQAGEEKYEAKEREKRVKIHQDPRTGEFVPKIEKEWEEKKRKEDPNRWREQV